MSDIDRILTAQQIAEIGERIKPVIGTRAYHQRADNIRSLLSEREVLLSLLAEVEPHWGEYSGMSYCLSCCHKITWAAGYKRDNPASTLKPHEPDCEHELIAQALKRAGR